jgi:hypothetical protein
MCTLYEGKEFVEEEMRNDDVAVLRLVSRDLADDEGEGAMGPSCHFRQQWTINA